MYQQYFDRCYGHFNAGIPVFCHITVHGHLSLVGYKLNPAVCEALGEFLAANNHLQSPYTVDKLVLDDNML